VAQWAVLDLRSIGRGFKSCSGKRCWQPWASCSHLCVSDTKQYNLVPAKRQWCSAAGKVTTGLAESNGSLQTGGWLTVTFRLTACTLGSAPGSTLGIEYGKPLLFTICRHENIWTNTASTFFTKQRRDITYVTLESVLGQSDWAKLFVRPTGTTPSGTLLVNCSWNSPHYRNMTSSVHKRATSAQPLTHNNMKM